MNIVSDWAFENPSDNIEMDIVLVTALWEKSTGSYKSRGTIEITKS